MAQPHILNGKDPAPRTAARLARGEVKRSAQAIGRDVRVLWSDVKSLFRSAGSAARSEVQRSTHAAGSVTSGATGGLRWLKQTIDARPALVVGAAIGAGLLIGLAAAARKR